jgi:hypothetical protein
LAAHDHWHAPLVNGIAAGDVRAARRAVATMIDINRRFLQHRRNGQQ